jgi:hypothetical protein
MMLENYMEEKHIPPIQHALRIVKQNTYSPTNNNIS